MKQLVDGLLYDTDKSKLLATLSYNGSCYSYADLYVMDDCFFIHQQCYELGSDIPKENIVVVDKKRAYDFIISTKDEDVCMCKGEIKEAASEYFEI